MQYGSACYIIKVKLDLINFLNVWANLGVMQVNRRNTHYQVSTDLTPSTFID